MNILILEDDFNLANSLKEVLELEGFNVDIAYNSEDAYDKIYNNKYDLLIFDINLPDENGIEVLKNLRLVNINIPTIYITALTDIKTMAMAFEAGAEDFIKKPFDVEEFLIRVKSKVKQNIKINDIEYNPVTKEIKKNNNIIYLPNTLKEIFHKLATNKNRLVNKDELLELTSYSDASLRVNINKLKKLLGLNIKNIRGEGYILEES